MADKNDPLKNKALRTSGKYLIIFLIMVQNPLFGQTKFIKPGAVWTDQANQPIQAHGGCIIKIAEKYYWNGQQSRQGLDSSLRYVSCYSSADLMNWTFENDVVQMSDPEALGTGWILERPHVFHDAAANKFVMYFHLDNKKYNYARVGIAISDHPNGNFKYVKSMRPLGRPSRDIGQFIDDDGTSYLIFEDRELGFHIVKLSADLMSIEKEMSLVRAHLEGGAIVHYEGLYYVIGSGLTGWDPNPNKYATAKSLEGPWSEFKDIAPPETNTYRSQSTMLLKVTGTKATNVIYMGDQWKPERQWDSRYLWMPLVIGNGKLWLTEPRPWSVNVRTGTVEFVKQPK